jgi:hypothetical protein
MINSGELFEGIKGRILLLKPFICSFKTLFC